MCYYYYASFSVELITNVMLKAKNSVKTITSVQSFILNGPPFVLRPRRSCLYVDQLQQGKSLLYTIGISNLFRYYYILLYTDTCESLPILSEPVIVWLLDSFKVLLNNTPTISIFINNRPPTDSFCGCYILMQNKYYHQHCNKSQTYKQNTN